MTPPPQNAQLLLIQPYLFVTELDTEMRISSIVALCLGLTKKMFVSCNPTVPRKWPVFKILFCYINHPKNTVFTIFNFFCKPDFSSDFALKISFSHGLVNNTILLFVQCRIFVQFPDFAFGSYYIDIRCCDPLVYPGIISQKHMKNTHCKYK